MKINVQPVRGTKDYLPKEAELRDYVREKIEQTYKSYGFNKIFTPVMEDIERLDKSDGGENLAMIFKLLKRGQKLDLTKPDLTENDLVDSGLRYDLTMPLSRYFANNRQFLSMPFKSIQIDKVFRAERPQKGRLREFYQCDIDIIGDASVNAEKELIAATSAALLNIGFDGFTVRINDRRILSGMIKAAGFGESDVGSVCIIFDKLDKIGFDGVKAELLEKGYDADAVAKFMAILSESEEGGLNAAAKYCEDAAVANDLKSVVEFANRISGGKFNAVYDKSLVRGMGYYTGMVFEIASPKFGSSVGGGGRYDNMIGTFSGEAVPAVGFSIGFERVCAILTEEGYKAPGVEKVILLYNGEDDFAAVLEKARELIGQGMAVLMLKRSKKLGKQMDALIETGYMKSCNFADGSFKELAAKA